MSPAPNASHAVVSSPIGPVLVCWNEDGVCWLRAAEPGALPPASLASESAEAPDWLCRALASLDGDDVPVDLSSTSGFQQRVLQATRRIPRGSTQSYAWLAQQVGQPGAVRAVGTALARNPVPLLVPCHRVVRTDGKIGEFIFGTEAKRRLLELERVS